MEDDNTEISREEFENLRNQVKFIDEQGTRGVRQALAESLKEHHDKVMFWSLLIITLCFVGFAGLNAWFVIWDVSNSQHVWCHVLNTITNAPAPATSTPGPSRSYAYKLAQDFIELKRNFRC